MTTTASTTRLPKPGRDIRILCPHEMGRHAQRGIVLVISLIFIVVISLLAATSMRSAGSSESISGNVRTTELATQAAEIALRHCESSTLEVVSPTGAFATSFTVANILPVNSVTWQNTATWDSTSAATYVLPINLVGTATFKRSPECMVELLSTGAVTATDAAFVITARGFGPEVAAADAARTRPVGTVVWLQSTLQKQ